MFEPLSVHEPGFNMEKYSIPSFISISADNNQ